MGKSVQTGLELSALLVALMMAKLSCAEWGDARLPGLAMRHSEHLHDG